MGEKAEAPKTLQTAPDRSDETVPDAALLRDLETDDDVRGGALPKEECKK